MFVAYKVDRSQQVITVKVAYSNRTLTNTYAYLYIVYEITQTHAK